MSLRYGFFNSINNDRRYDALDMSSIFDGIIEDGVFATIAGIFAVTAGEGMQVTVDSGKAWFNHTWTSNDTKIPLSIDAADITLDRYDAVVLEVNNEEAVRANSIKIVKGSIASEPQKPALVNTELVHQHPLAYIRVVHGATAIDNQYIENVIGTSECPFVTGPLETVPIDSLFARWEAEFDYWFENVKTQLSGDVAANLQRQIDERVKISNKATVEEAISGVDDTKWMTPKSVSFSNQKWRLIDKLDNAKPMSGEWSVPSIFGSDAYDLGVYEIGGGGGGGRASNAYAAASGGASGYGKNFIIKSAVPGTKIPYVIGAGGGAQFAGGSTSFNGEVAKGGESGIGKSASSRGCVAGGAFGGQGSDAVDDFGATDTKQSRRAVALYGGVSPAETVGRPTSSGTSTNYGVSYSQSPRESQNAFDPEMITLCAGGWATKYSSKTFKQTITAMPDGTKGGDGGGGNATGYGNGGGANISGAAGSGSDGVIFIYARRHIE